MHYTYVLVFNRRVLFYVSNQFSGSTPSLKNSSNPSRLPKMTFCTVYLYASKSRIHYSPNRYILKSVGASESNKLTLGEIMKDCRLTSRYYKDIKLGSGGQQPDNYHSFPPWLKIVWEQYERE